MRLGIVIQGPTRFYKEICEHYMAYDVVWSTWRDEPHQEYIRFRMPIISQGLLRDAGPRNINLQVRSSLRGIEYWANQGYTHVMKIRSDVLIHHHLDPLVHPDKPSFLCWHDHRGGYLTDYFFAGKVELMKRLCDFQVFNDAGWPPERYITNRLIGLGQREVHCMLPQLEYVDWLKNGTNIVDNCKHELYKVVDTI